MPRRHDMPPLRRVGLAGDPIEQFAEWWERAEREVPLPDAMCLATADAEGFPDARMVLLKGFDDVGFRFHTNYLSAKGRQLDANASGAIVVYWRELDRQVRARGPVERLSGAASDEYFATRPRVRQLGAWASPQSEVIATHEELDRRLADAEARFAGVDVERPEHWGGYLLRPLEVEFWQGAVGRLHDRFRYTRTDEGWRIERLGP